MDRIELADVSSVGAALLGGASVMVLMGATLPAMHRRRTILRHLRTVVDLAGTDGSAAGPAESLPRRFAWSGFRTEAPWLKRRVLPLLPFIIAPVIAYVLSHQVLITIATELQVWMFVSMWGQNSVAGRSAQIDAQMLPTVLRLTAAIRSGLSLAQALELIAADAPSPTREEFTNLLHEVSLGTSLDTALQHMADRLDTPDYLILSLVLTVQRRVGGNLPQVLDRICDAVRQRIEFRREVAVLTSQQRMSTWILALLPFFIGGAFFMADKSFMTPLFTTTGGHIVLLVASSLQLVGGWALRWAGKVNV